MSNKFDIGGILVSFGCMIHCIALPLMANTISLFSINLIHNVWIDIVLFAFAIYFGASTFIPSFKHHHKKLPIILFSIGITMLGIKEFLVLQTIQEYKLLWTTISLLGLLLSHILNMFYTKIAKHNCN